MDSVQTQCDIATGALDQIISSIRDLEDELEAKTNQIEEWEAYEQEQIQASKEFEELTSKYQKLEAENKELKEKDKEWTELMKGAMSSGLTGKVEKLTEELEQYQMSHPCDLKCENCGLTTTEDDLEISLSCGCLICESCQDEANLPDLKEEIEKLNEVITISCGKFSEENKKLKDQIDKMGDASVKDHPYCVKLREKKDKAMKLMSESDVENNELREEIKTLKKEKEKKEDEDKEEVNTKNIKGNRKIVQTLYAPTSAEFKIPDGLDLEDKSVVEYWAVKYGTLRIKYVGKEKEEEIEWEYEPEIDMKWGNDEIIDADEGNIEYEEDDEE